MTHRLYWLIFFCIMFASGLQLRAQNTITTEPLSISSSCPGSLINVRFTQTDTNTINQTFIVQLADGGAYKDIKTGAVGRISTTNSYTLSAIIPSATTAGARYSLRVTATNPAVVGTPSPTLLTVKAKPEPPITLPETVDCQKADGSNNVTVFISVTASSPTATTRLYDVNGNVVENLSSVFNDQSFVIYKYSSYGTKTFFVTQSIDGCESDKRQLKVVIMKKADVNVTPENVYGYRVIA